MDDDPKEPGGITLHFSEGSRAGSFLSLNAGIFTLGRRPDVEVPFDEQVDSRVSGRHVRLSARDGGWWLEDLMSSNGTLVNGVAARGPTRLQTRDVIDLGRHPDQTIDGFVRFSVSIEEDGGRVSDRHTEIEAVKRDLETARKEVLSLEAKLRALQAPSGL